MARSTIMDRICPWGLPTGKYRDSVRSVTLAQAPGVERDNWSPTDPRRYGLGELHGRLRHLLGDAEQHLAPVHFAPNVVGTDTGRSPENSEIIEEIGAFADHGLRVAVDGVDHDFDRF